MAGTWAPKRCPGPKSGARAWEAGVSGESEQSNFNLRSLGAYLAKRDQFHKNTSNNMSKRQPMKERSLGGSAQTRSLRNTKKSNRDENTMKRLLEKCEGSEGIERHRNNFKSLEAGTVPLGCVCGDTDSYIVALVELVFSDREIRKLLGIGGYRIYRVRKEMSNPSLRLKRHERKVPSHAFTEQDFENLKQHVATWNIRLEDGFACAHTIQKDALRMKASCGNICVQSK